MLTPNLKPDKFIPYGKQDITDEDIQSVVKVLKSDFLTQGPAVKEFEDYFASLTGAKYAIAVTNGTAALHISAMALGVKAGSTVISTPITFAASTNCILYCGGEVEFADINPETALLDVDHVKKMLHSKPKGYYSGLVVVDFAGYPSNLESFRNLADEFNLWIIQDACHSLGGSFNDSKGIKQNCGNCAYSDVTVFSFHPVKHVATGEGGMITTNSEQVYKKLIKLRTHGITKDSAELMENPGGWYYEMQELGYNYRISDILCSLGTSQLKRLEENISKRRKIAQRYNKALQSVGSISIVGRPENSSIGHAYHLYVIHVKERLELYNYLKENQIYSQVHYIPVYKLPYYKKIGFGLVNYPHAEAYYEGCLSLPMYASLTVDEQAYVIKCILSFYKQG